MTVQVLKQAGIGVVEEHNRWVVSPGVPALPDVTIEPTRPMRVPSSPLRWSRAGSCVSGNWPRHTTQPGDSYRKILSAMGGRFRFLEGDALHLTGPKTTDCMMPI